MTKKSTNPFDDEYEPVDVLGGSAHFGGNSRLFTPNGSMALNSVEAQIMTSKERYDASYQRALASIHHSTEIGAATLTDLSLQGEKLGRIEDQLHDIAEVQKETQKNINKLSSFGTTIRNMFSRSQSQPSLPPRPTNNVSVTSPNSNNPKIQNSNLQTQVRQNLEKTPDSDFERNLTSMSIGIGNLRSMAESMGTEIRQQNQQLDRISSLVSVADDKMVSQNRQMNNLLGNKR